MEYRRLSECAVFSEKRTKNIDRETYISTENMLPQKGGITEIESEPEISSASKYEPGDILLSNIRPYFQKIWYANREGSCSNDVLVVKIKNDEIDSRFLYYVLSEKTFFDYATLTSKGTKMPRGTKNAIMKYIVPSIAINHQQKIASILSAYDNLIENNNKRIKLLEKMAEDLYKEWFVRFRFPGHENVKMVDGIPEGWKKGRIYDVVKQTGKNVKRESRDNYECYVPIDVIPKKSLTYIDCESIDMAESSLISFEPSDILFGSMRVYFHKVCVARHKGLTRSTCFVMNAKDKTYYGYSVMMLFSEHVVNMASQSSSGATMPYIKWDRFARLPIIIPDKETAAAFGRIIYPYLQLIQKSAGVIQSLTMARNYLLPRLMSGKLEIKLS